MIEIKDSLQRRCNVCLKTKSLTEFYNDKSRSLGKSYTCKICKNTKVIKYRSSLSDEVLLERGLTTNKIRRSRYYKKYKNTTIKESLLRTRYGITSEILEKMKIDQNYKCKICGKSVTLVVDHCHKSYKVRGLLCNNCNSGLGMFNDNIETIKNALKYLENNI